MILIRHTTVLRIVKIKKNGAVMYVNQKKKQGYQNLWCNRLIYSGKQII